MDHKADYGVFFGEPGSVEDPAETLGGVLGGDLVLAERLGDRVVRLLFAPDGPLAALNEAHPMVTPNGMLGYEDEDIPYDRYAFEIGFVRDLREEVELLAVLELARLLRRANVAVMVDEGGEKVVPLDEMAPSRDEGGSSSCELPILAVFLVVAFVATSAVFVQVAGVWALVALLAGGVAVVPGVIFALGVTDRARDRRLGVTGPYNGGPVGGQVNVGARAGRCTWCREPAALAVAVVDLGRPVVWAGICTVCAGAVIASPPGRAPEMPESAGGDPVEERLHSGDLGHQIYRAMKAGPDGRDCVWCGRPGSLRQFTYLDDEVRLCDGCHAVMTEATDQTGLKPLMAASVRHGQLKAMMERIEATGEVPAETCWLCQRRGRTVTGVLRSPLPPRWGDQVAVRDPVLCRRHAHLCVADSPAVSAGLPGGWS